MGNVEVHDGRCGQTVYGCGPQSVPALDPKVVESVRQGRIHVESERIKVDKNEFGSQIQFL